MENLIQSIRSMIVEQLRLTIAPESIGEDTPLFGEGGMGFDSVDALELVLGLEQHFGVEVADEEVGRRVLQSVRTMADFVREQRVGAA